ncbi:hypothetical protein VPH35_020040 [Triticum aestivum]
MSMDPHAVLLLTLVLLLGTGDGSLAVGTPSAIIRTTCAAVGVGYDSCDARELVVVATSLIVANVTSTVLVLDDLVKNLGECLRSYRHMNKNLEGVLGDLAAGRLKAATDKLLHASFAPSDYDILLLEGRAEKNPMSEENNDARWLFRLAE